MKNNKETTIKDEPCINQLSNISDELIRFDNKSNEDEDEYILYTFKPLQISDEKQKKIINILISAKKEDRVSIQFPKNKDEDEKLTYMSILSLTKKHLPQLKLIFPYISENQIQQIQNLMEEDSISTKNDAKELDNNQQQETTRFFEQRLEVADEEYQKKQKKKAAKKQRMIELKNKQKESSKPTEEQKSETKLDQQTNSTNQDSININTQKQQKKSAKAKALAICKDTEKKQDQQKKVIKTLEQKQKNKKAKKEESKDDDTWLDEFLEKQAATKKNIKNLRESLHDSIMRFDDDNFKKIIEEYFTNYTNLHLNEEIKNLLNTIYIQRFASYPEKITNAKNIEEIQSIFNALNDSIISELEPFWNKKSKDIKDNKELLLIKYTKIINANEKEILSCVPYIKRVIQSNTSEYNEKKHLFTVLVDQFQEIFNQNNVGDEANNAKNNIITDNNINDNLQSSSTELRLLIYDIGCTQQFLNFLLLNKAEELKGDYIDKVNVNKVTSFINTFKAHITIKAIATSLFYINELTQKERDDIIEINKESNKHKNELINSNGINEDSQSQQYILISEEIKIEESKSDTYNKHDDIL